MSPKSRMLIALLAVMVPSLAFGQAAPSVTIAGSANMPSLKDDAKLDDFTTILTDAQITSKLVIQCTAAGHNDFGFIRRDRICGLQKESTGAVFNQGKWFPRTQYTGSYTVSADGTTDARTLGVNYTALGKVPASSAQFSGSLNLKPSLTSQGADALKQLVLKKLGTDANSPINTAVDTIDFNSLGIPGAGLPSDKGCTIKGNAVFAYQTYSWFWKISITTNSDNKAYDLSGNMPFTDVPNSTDGSTEYDLVLTLPSTAVSGDDALFADASGNDDLFAVADGLTGQIVMTNSSNVDVMIDGEKVSTPSVVDFSGSIVGNNVPLELVRCFSEVLGLLPVTFYGP